jgi:hypothetical protein
LSRVLAACHARALLPLFVWLFVALCVGRSAPPLTACAPAAARAPPLLCLTAGTRRAACFQFKITGRCPRVPSIAARRRRVNLLNRAAPRPPPAPSSPPPPQRWAS